MCIGFISTSFCLYAFKEKDEFSFFCTSLKPMEIMENKIFGKRKSDEGRLAQAFICHVMLQLEHSFLKMLR